MSSLAYFRCEHPNRFFSDVVWAEQNLPSSVCRWFTCQPAHSSETPLLSSPLLTTLCLTNGCPPCLTKGRFHGVGWAWRVSNGRSLRNPPSLPTVHAKLTPTENLVAFEHQKKNHFNPEGGAVGRTTRIAGYGLPTVALSTEGWRPLSQLTYRTCHRKPQPFGWLHKPW